MRNKTSGLATFALTASLATIGCDDKRDSRANRLEKSQPTEEVTYSLERANINRRIKLANDPNQIMWIYCLSDMGNVVMSSPVVGKVTSSNKRLEPNTTITNVDATDRDSESFEKISADGTYGSSDPYVFWFTPEGQYFQWNGEYVVSNAPLRVERPIFNVRDIDYQELEKAQKAERALKAGKKVGNDLNIEGGK